MATGGRETAAEGAETGRATDPGTTASADDRDETTT
jgi:hypothetical protein